MPDHRAKAREGQSAHRKMKTTDEVTASQTDQKPTSETQTATPATTENAGNPPAPSPKKKRVRKATSSAAPAQPAAATAPVKPPVPVAREPEALEYTPYDEAAWEWMRKGSIPGAYPPVTYVGTDVSAGVSRILGRSITLDEAQQMVHADGEIAICSVTGKEFQPIAYLPFVPNNLASKIEAGMALTEIDLPMGGAFYLNKSDEIVALSGSVYHYARRFRGGQYVWFKDSPLCQMALAMKEKTGEMDWGTTLEGVQRRLQAKQETARQEKAINDLAGSIQSNRRRKGSHDNGGTHQRDHRMGRAQMDEALEKGKGRRNNHVAVEQE